MKKTPILIVTLALPLLLSACQSSGQRAIHMVEASGDRALARQDFALAEQEYAEVVERNPASWRARLQYGKALLSMNKPRQAREQLEIAYTIRPKDPEVIENLGLAMAGSRDYDSAIRLLRTLAEDRKRPDDWIRLGKVAWDAKDLDTAETSFLTAATADAGIHVEPQMQLFDFYTALGREEEALERLRSALWIQPTNFALQAKARELGYEPDANFARRPLEQANTAIPEPFMPRRN